MLAVKLSLNTAIMLHGSDTVFAESHHNGLKYMISAVTITYGKPVPYLYVQRGILMMIRVMLTTQLYEQLLNIKQL
jgi:hypothetical protein